MRSSRSIAIFEEANESLAALRSPWDEAKAAAMVERQEAIAEEGVEAEAGGTGRARGGRMGPIAKGVGRLGRGVAGFRNGGIGGRVERDVEEGAVAERRAAADERGREGCSIARPLPFPPSDEPWSLLSNWLSQVDASGWDGGEGDRLGR